VEPKVRIVSRDGSYDKTFSTSLTPLASRYAWGIQEMTWQEPPRVNGPFTARLELEGPFERVSTPLIIEPAVQE
jgi:hypothetical protein